MLTREKYNKIRNVYWVYVGLNSVANPFEWVYSILKPKEHTNPHMTWRNPTYEEAIHRQKEFEKNRLEFENKKRKTKSLCMIK